MRPSYTKIVFLAFLVAVYPHITIAMDEGVGISDDMKSCVQNSDCVRIKKLCTACSFPQVFDAINKTKMHQFDDMFSRQCTAIDLLCELNMPVCGEAICKNNLCEYEVAPCPVPPIKIDDLSDHRTQIYTQQTPPAISTSVKTDTNHSDVYPAGH